MGDRSDWEQRDEAMQEELENLGLDSEWERERARSDREAVDEYYKNKILWLAEMGIYARFCPRCGIDCGPVSEVEPADPMVGTMQAAWVNECPKHGHFAVHEDLTVSYENMH